MPEVPAGIASWEHINMCGRDSHFKMSLGSALNGVDMSQAKSGLPPTVTVIICNSPRPNILHILLYNIAHF